MIPPKGLLLSASSWFEMMASVGSGGFAKAQTYLKSTKSKSYFPKNYSTQKNCATLHARLTHLEKNIDGGATNDDQTGEVIVLAANRGSIAVSELVSDRGYICLGLDSPNGSRANSDDGEGTAVDTNGDGDTCKNDAQETGDDACDTAARTDDIVTALDRAAWRVRAESNIGRWLGHLPGVALTSRGSGGGGRGCGDGGGGRSDGGERREDSEVGELHINSLLESLVDAVVALTEEK